MSNQCLAVGLLAILFSSPIVAADNHRHSAHAHGKGELEITVQGNALHGEFRTPMDSLLGFEHQPKTAAQKASVDQLREQLKDLSVIIRPNPEARCALKRYDVASPMFSGTVKGSHSELTYKFSFECAASGNLTSLEVTALQLFKRLLEVRVQVVSEQNQRAVTLKKGNTLLPLSPR